MGLSIWNELDGESGRFIAEWIQVVGGEGFVTSAVL